MPDISASFCSVRRCDLRHVRNVLIVGKLHQMQKNGKGLDKFENKLRSYLSFKFINMTI